MRLAKRARQNSALRVVSNETRPVPRNAVRPLAARAVGLAEGEFQAGAAHVTDMVERFWSFVDKSGECWTWTGRTTDGYGRFSVGTKTLAAHRVSWHLHFLPIPSDILVCHRCDNPLCVRPSHLFAGTSLDNNRDRATKRRTRTGREKLTTRDVGLLRLAHETLPEVTQTELARSFGITSQYCGKILAGKTKLWGAA